MSAFHVCSTSCVRFLHSLSTDDKIKSLVEISLGSSFAGFNRQQWFDDSFDSFVGHHSASRSIDLLSSVAHFRSQVSSLRLLFLSVALLNRHAICVRPFFAVNLIFLCSRPFVRQMVGKSSADSSYLAVSLEFRHSPAHSRLSVSFRYFQC